MCEVNKDTKNLININFEFIIKLFKISIIPRNVNEETK